jgi:hypothetical protein
MNSCVANRRSAFRRILFFTLLVLAVMLARPARVCFAADAKAQADLESAEQSLVNMEYEAANKTAERVLRQRGLSHEQLVRAYRVLAITHAVLDHEAPAREAFLYLLTIDPEYTGDANLGPKVQGPFMEARGTIRAQAVKPGIEVSAVLHAGEAGTLRVTTRDPTHITKKVNVGWRWGSDGTFTVSAVSAGDGQVVTVPAAPTGTSRLDYYAQAVDDREAAVFEVGNPSVPKSATVDVSGGGFGGAGNGAEKPAESKSVFASPVFWVITGVIVAGGAVTAGLLLSKNNDKTQTVTKTETLPPTSATLLPGLQCGQVRCN